MENTASENQSPEKPVVTVQSRFNKRTLFIALAIAAVLIVGALAFAKGLVVAATVNGTPISRLAIINELEKRGGKEALDNSIQKSLIDSELRAKGITVAQEDVDAEIKKIEAQVASQGGTLEQALAQQGMTEAELREQILERKQIEKALADTIDVTDAEVDAYIKEQKMNPSEGETAEAHKAEVKEQLRSQKTGAAAQQWIAGLKAKANITYYVNY